LVKEESGNLLADALKILNKCKYYYCQQLNEHGTGGVRQVEIHSAQPSVLEPSASEVEAAIGKLNRYKSPDTEQILTELIQAGGDICIVRSINLLS
jgi:hypothetical protein